MDRSIIEPLPSRRAVLGLALGSALLAACKASSSGAAATAATVATTTTTPTSTGAPTSTTVAATDASLPAATAATTVASAPSGTTAAWTTDELVAIPADTSFRFATAVSGNGAGDRAPIAEPYHLSRTMVTNRQWEAFVATGGARSPRYWNGTAAPADRVDHPVAGITGTDAVAYCAWLTAANPGWLVRLPTEAEWEHAATGGAGQRYPWGDDLGAHLADGVLTARCNYNGVVSAWALAAHAQEDVTYTSRSSRAGQRTPLSSVLSVGADGSVQGWIDHATNTGFVFTDLYESISTAGGFTTPVGSYAGSGGPFDLADIVGNLWEWTSTTITAANGAEAGQVVNAVRGGSWYATSRSCRATYRGEGRAIAGGYPTVGLRVAATRS